MPGISSNQSTGTTSTATTVQHANGVNAGARQRGAGSTGLTSRLANSHQVDQSTGRLATTDLPPGCRAPAYTRPARGDGGGRLSGINLGKINKLTVLKVAVLGAVGGALAGGFFGTIASGGLFAIPAAAIGAVVGAATFGLLASAFLNEGLFGDLDQDLQAGQLGDWQRRGGEFSYGTPAANQQSAPEETPPANTTSTTVSVQPDAGRGVLPSGIGPLPNPA